MFTKLGISSLAVALLINLPAGALAQDYTETGDAGQSFATAQGTDSGLGANQPLGSFVGTLSSGTDADVFAIYITDPSTFSATTVNSLTASTSLDTQLFLFDSAGKSVYGNDDDASGITLGSTLPAGSSFGPQVAGIYYIGISLSGSEPVDFGSQLMFLVTQSSTDIRTPNPNAVGAVAGYNTSQTTSQTGGSYQVDLTSAQTAPAPEPTPIALLGLSLFGWAVIARGRRA